MSHYEVAIECRRLHTDEKMTSAEIAVRFHVERLYVNNLLRLLERLHPSIIEDWRQGDPRAKLSTLTNLATHNHAVQLRRWNAGWTPPKN